MPSTDISCMQRDEPIWVLYPWFEEDGPGFIHPTDYESFCNQKPYGAVFKKCGNEGNYTVIGRGPEKFRVLPKLMRPAPTSLKWRIDIGDHVELKDINNIVEILDVRWHSKLKCPMFFISINGKKKSKRYFVKDFII